MIVSYSQMRNETFALGELEGHHLSASNPRHCKVHAVALSALRELDPNMYSLGSKDRSLHRDMARKMRREVRRRFGFIGGLLLSILIGVIVQIIVRWIVENYFTKGTYSYRSEIIGDVNSWLADPEFVRSYSL